MKIIASLGMTFILYKLLIAYLIKQSAKPQGIIGQIITKIWSKHFDGLSKWTIDNTPIKDNDRVLEIGYGGGSNINNLIALNRPLSIYGVDISQESYLTATALNKHAIDKGEVTLTVGDTSKLMFSENYFNLVFATQTHMYWDNLEKGLTEIYRVIAENSVLILSSEKDTINYHMKDFNTTDTLTALLKDIGFKEVAVKELNQWILYAARKNERE